MYLIIRTLNIFIQNRNQIIKGLTLIFSVLVFTVISGAIYYTMIGKNNHTNKEYYKYEKDKVREYN